MRKLLLLITLAAGTVYAQEDYRMPSAARVAEYQERLAKVYLPAGLSETELVQRMRDYFGSDYGGVEFEVERRKDGTVDYVVYMRRDDRIVYMATIATVARVP